MPSESPQFVDHFWGDRHLGYETLQQNLKHATRSTSELLDLLRESCSLQDTNFKALSKFARQMGSYNSSGCFTPCWTIVKILLESQSALHLALHQYWTALMKDVQKYADELSRKFREVKELEAPTQEVVSSFQTATQQLQKSRETYHARRTEWKKLRPNEMGVNGREMEKMQLRLLKAQNEYKYMVERYNNLRNTFIEKMRVACFQHQTLEHAHLQQMRQFLSRYVHGLNSFMESSSKPLQQFQQSLTRDLTLQRLLQRFVVDKGTGRHIPVAATFEEEELMSLDRNNSSSSLGKARAQTSDVLTDAIKTDSPLTKEAPRKSSVSDLLSHGIAINTKSANLTDTSDGSPQTENLSTSASSSSSSKARGLLAIVRVMRPSHLTSAAKSSESTVPLPSPPPNSFMDWRCETPSERPVDEQGYSLPPVDIWKRPDAKEDHSSSESSEEDDVEKKTLPKVFIRPLDHLPDVPKDFQRPQIPSDANVLRKEKCGTLTRISQGLMQPPAPSGGGRANKGRVIQPAKSPLTCVMEDQFGFAEFDSEPQRQQRCKSVADLLHATEETDGDITPVLPSETNTTHKDVHLLTSGGLYSSMRCFRPSHRRQASVEAPFKLPSPPSNGNGTSEVSKIESAISLIVTPKMKITDPWGPESLETNNHELSPSIKSSKPTSLPEASVPTLKMPPSNQIPTEENSTREDGYASSPVPVPLPPPRTIANSVSELAKPIGGDKRISQDRNAISLAVSTTEIHHAKFCSGQTMEHTVDGELLFAFPAHIQQRLTYPSQLPPLSFQLKHVQGVQLDSKFFLNTDSFHENNVLANRDPEVFHLHVENVRKYVLAQLSTAQQHRSHVTVGLLRYKVPSSCTDPHCTPLSLNCAWTSISDTTLHLTVHYHLNKCQLVPLELVIFCNLPLSDSAVSMRHSPLLIMECPSGGAIKWEEGRVEWPVLLSEGAMVNKSHQQLQKVAQHSIEAKFILNLQDEVDQISLMSQPVHARFTFDDPRDEEGRFTLLSTGYRLSLHKRRIISGQYVSSPD